MTTDASNPFELRRDPPLHGYLEKCSVIDKRTKQVVGYATAKDTAAGGSNVECSDVTANGQAIVFTNSRGTYVKDARPGKTNDRSLPCGEGIYADDLSSCVELDIPAFAMYASDDEKAPFDIRMFDVASHKETTLLSIPGGRNRITKAPNIAPRSWDAKYCGVHRVVVTWKGVAYTFEAPSGKPLEKKPAPATCPKEIK